MTKIYTTERFSSESRLNFSTKSQQISSFAWSARERIAFGFYSTKNLRQYFPVQTSHLVNKSLVRNYAYVLYKGNNVLNSKVKLPRSVDQIFTE